MICISFTGRVVSVSCPVVLSKSKKYPNANITFMTAHSSKGLGYDNVILINMIEGKFGFPCQIEDDLIIKLVTYEDKSMPFAEERRLFYVAMTRTKNRVYIAASKTKAIQIPHRAH